MIDDRCEGENLNAEWLLANCTDFQFKAPNGVGAVSVSAHFILTGQQKSFVLTARDQGKIISGILAMEDTSDAANELLRELDSTLSFHRDHCGPGRE